MAQPTQPYTGQVPEGYQFQPPQYPQPPAGYQMPPQYQPPQPADKDPYAVTSWGKLEDYTTPSGQRCALRPLDLDHLLALGILDQLNSLAGVVETDVIRPAQGLPPIDSAKLMADPKRVNDLMRVIDEVVVSIVAKPALVSCRDENGQRIPEAKRKPGEIYVDSVGLPDRMDLFNKAMEGVQALQSFRPKSAEPGVGMAGQPGGALPSQ